MDSAQAATNSSAAAGTIIRDDDIGEYSWLASTIAQRSCGFALAFGESNTPEYCNPTCGSCNHVAAVSNQRINFIDVVVTNSDRGRGYQPGVTPRYNDSVSGNHGARCSRIVRNALPICASTALTDTPSCVAISEYLRPRSRLN